MILNLSEAKQEPDDGTMIVLIEADGERKVIWRDDEQARGQSEIDEERWFDESDGDPLDWPEITKYATVAYRVPSTPFYVLEEQ